MTGYGVPSSDVMGTAGRLRSAAFDLFSVQGFDATTVDEIALRAGVGRTTYFRHFRTKEDVVFPDHPALAAEVAASLAGAGDRAPVDAVTRAALLVLDRYVAEGELARTRYRLVTSIERLRARELASTLQYQRAFGDYLRRVLGPDPRGALYAEVVAAAVIAAHNHVLRRWLRGQCPDPRRELGDVLAEVFDRWAAPGPDVRERPAGTTVVVLDSTLPPEVAGVLVEQALGAHRTVRTDQ